MKLLILGGGVFLGAEVLRSALAGGHAVTVFNRGQARSDWPAGVDAVVGDRRHDLDRLQGRRFDAVVDTCGYVPADVRASAATLRALAPVCCFVSSISAYASFTAAPKREDDALAPFDGIDASDRNPAHYGAQKAACEAEVSAVFGDRAFIVRPGLIVGPGDPTGRFSHWPWRAMSGGEMLMPDAPETEPLQAIDVRDLGAWIVRALEAGTTGVFNATGPVGEAAWTWPAFVATCVAEARQRAATPVRVGEAFLLEQGVAPWNELPLWLPSSDADYHAHSRVSIERAARAGLTTRPLAETVAAVMAEGVPAADDPRRKTRLMREREAELIAQWRALTPLAAQREARRDHASDALPASTTA